uniref:Myocardial zonula adherens protein n=1 Tax=Lepisosteus oculatus TaxID=7918 RepID=W5N7W9_LEPOC
MSSSWTERQGKVGDLNSKSKEELYDILTRQEKLLANTRFVQSLPDKGKKILDFVQKIHVAIADHEETQKRTQMLLSVKTELQSKYQQTLKEQRIGTFQMEDLEMSHENGTVETDITARKRDKTTLKVESELSRTVADGAENSVTQADNSAGIKKASTTAASLGETGLRASSETRKEQGLIEAFGRVTLTDDTSPGSNDRLSGGDGSTGREPPQKKPHYIEVLEKTEKSPPVRKAKFKPNQLPQKSCGSSAGSSSPSLSSGAVSPLPLAERKLRDRKHLDDITAAKLPPLHHTPTQLLCLEESAALQQEQKKKYEGLQAKLAAQKLSEKLNVKMVSYSPEGGELTKYREFHDDGATHSSEDD